MINYKLYDENTYSSALETILQHRGLKGDLDKWINAGWNEINDWRKLKNINMMVAILNTYMSHKSNFMIIVDCDCDGFCSAAILVNYLYRLDPTVKDRLYFYFHSGKQHGLADFVQDWTPQALKDLQIESIICPDSASNDVEECKLLSDNCFSILVLDHHEIEIENPYAIIANNQACDYPNKNFCGAGIVWQLCRAYDEMNNVSFADTQLDLCALGNAGDMMDSRELETRAVMNLGLSDVHNPFFKGMVEKNDYSLQKMGGINYLSIAFYVVPFINAVQRSGTQEEKEMLFKAMCEPFAYDEVPSGKRGCGDQMVPIWEECVRVVGNVKNRQTKLQNQSLDIMEKKIKDENLLDNKVLVLKCEPQDVERSIAGLAANKLQAKYQRPTLVLTKCWDEGDKEYFYRGSARNYSMCELQDFKSIVGDFEKTTLAQGHAGAFGVCVYADAMDNLDDYFNEIYKDIEMEPVYWVDYVFNQRNMEPRTILDIANCDKFYGQGIPEAQVVIKDIPLDRCSKQLCGSKNNVLRLTLPNGVVCVNFNVPQDKFDEMQGNNKYITAICRCKRNEWNGNISGELIIDNYEVREEFIF